MISFLSLNSKKMTNHHLVIQKNVRHMRWKISIKKEERREKIGAQVDDDRNFLISLLAVSFWDWSNKLFSDFFHHHHWSCAHARVRDLMHVLYTGSNCRHKLNITRMKFDHKKIHFWCKTLIFWLKIFLY